MCMIIQFNSLRIFPLVISLILVLAISIYRKYSNVNLIIDLRACPNIGYYRLCSASFLWGFLDRSKEYSQQLLLSSADHIYIAKPELKFIFPIRIQSKIVVDKQGEIEM